LLPNVAYLTPNESEAARLTGIPVGDEASARQAAAQLRAAGARCVIVTLGAAGAWLSNSHRDMLIQSVQVDAVDTTAAGDAFNAGLAYALACKMDMQQAVRQACLVGALSATRLGAQPSLPTCDELLDFMKRHKI
jgi:ribokinase